MIIETDEGIVEGRREKRLIKQLREVLISMVIFVISIVIVTAYVKLCMWAGKLGWDLIRL